MKASEALKIVEEAKPTNMNPIYSEIMKAAQAAKRECFYYKTISELQLKELKDNGYKVSNESDWRDGTMYRIKW